ncbi:MAG: glycosyltransferase, partial [Gammaproteobacteria bacterium]|nr:glycosyltransferase [Gammaproteobacteria bacterium]
ISRSMLERLSDKGIPEDKLMLLPNWFHTEQIRPDTRLTEFRFEWGMDENQVVALYAGSIGEKQGMGVLLEAVAELEGEKMVKFVVCSEGPAFLRLKAKYGHLSNVIWRDLVPPERLNDLLVSADIHLLPQRADAADLVMPSKLTGMLASGRPVLATAVPGTQLADVVEGRGLVMPPGDVAALVAGIRRLAGDADMRLRFGRSARDYAVEHLDREKILGSFERKLTARVSNT